MLRTISTRPAPEAHSIRLERVEAVIEILEGDAVPNALMLKVLRAELDDIRGGMLGASEI